MGETTFAELGIDIRGRTSGNVKTTCPQCAHDRKKSRDPSLSVNISEGVYLCHHCGWKGGLQGERDWRNTTRVIYQRPPQPASPGLSPKALAFLTQRGIPEQVARAAGVYDNGKALAIPYTRGGEVIHVKYRALDDKRFWSTPDTEPAFYGLDWSEAAETVVIVEGEMDALACRTAGVSAVLSVPNGAPAVGAQVGAKLDCMSTGETIFAEAQRVILATDADAPGKALADELIRRIGPEKCCRVVWDEGVKDANDCLLSAGPEYLRTVIDTAEPIPVEGIITAHELGQQLDDLYEHGEDRGVAIGYLLLDRHYRVKPGYMTVITGIPSHGKSSVLNQFLVKLAERHEWTFAIFSPEQQPAYKMVQHLIEIKTGKPMLDGPTPRMTKGEMHDARRWVGDRFAVLVPEDPSIETILNLARIQVFRSGVRGVVVDPWNELEHSRPRHMSETEYISHALSAFRRFAIMQQVHVWIVAHPTKLRRDDKDGREPVPTLYDIAGSANFRNKADMGLTVWRDAAAGDNRVQVHITKVRYREQGEEGCVEFDYDLPTKRLFEIGVVR